ncbi:MAG TPA: amidohydrolase family protein [Tepidisphaeraceae bacterium]
MTRVTFRARHLATMTEPLIDDGCVVVEGDCIVAVGRIEDLRPPKVDHDIDGVLMPGLINAHTHLELTNVPRPASPGTFQDWLLTTMAASRQSEGYNHSAAVEAGVAQCLRFGVTCVGDIAQQVGLAREVLRDMPIRAVSFGECLGLSEGRFELLLTKATTCGEATERLQLGVSPHAPYTVHEEGYRRAFEAASECNCPVTTHLAETADEAPFLRDHGGAFAELYHALGIDPGESPRWDKPIEAFVESLKPRSLPLLCAHMNVATPALFRLMGARKMDVVWCPRTHAYFGRGPHPWRAMRAAGMRVCVGTDSCASSPDLNLVDDLRLILEQEPSVAPELLWSMVTIDAAEALGWSGVLIGRLEAGAAADFVVFPTTGGNPLREILDSPAMLPSAVWVAGQRVGPS